MTSAMSATVEIQIEISFKFEMKFKTGWLYKEASSPFISIAKILVLSVFSLISYIFSTYPLLTLSFSSYLAIQVSFPNLFFIYQFFCNSITCTHIPLYYYSKVTVHFTVHSVYSFGYYYLNSFNMCIYYMHSTWVFPGIRAR